jgi:DNA-binding transcriptional regulator YdaS (Cro superfamily)
MTRSAFAEAIGVSPSYVTLLCSGEHVWPGREVAGRIRDVTSGRVTADDFLPPQSSSETKDAAA